MAAPVPWVSCPRTVLLVEPERGGDTAGVPAVPHLPGAVGHPGGSFPHPQPECFLGRRRVCAAGAPSGEYGPRDGMSFKLEVAVLPLPRSSDGEE